MSDDEFANSPLGSRRNVTFQQKMTKIDQKILLGIFDSGVGGFSVLNEIKKTTSADIVYYGDCARAPYGNKSSEVIVSYMKETITYLQSKGVTHFVSACNSMSVVTTNALLKECGVSTSRYIDMTRAYNAFSIFSGREVTLVIGTHATIQSGAYQSMLQNKSVLFYEYEFPSLAGAIEDGESDVTLVTMIKPALLYAKMVHATHILYGCTHYPLVHDLFLETANEVDWKGFFIDPAQYVARAVDAWRLCGTDDIVFETSKETEVFKKMINQIEKQEKRS